MWDTPRIKLKIKNKKSAKRLMKRIKNQNSQAIDLKWRK
jgi:hypothetical protein